MAILVVVSASAAQRNDPPMTRLEKVTGKAVLVQAHSRAPLKDASRVVFWLSPRNPIPQMQASSDRPEYRMVQHNKSFEPNMLVVPTGTVVDFPNLDPWFHNVFSLYQGKRFDLGLYEAGSHKQVVFDRPGASYVFCNIHPQMTAVVLAVDSEFFGISDKAGRVAINDVPAGTYDLHIWYEFAMPKALEALSRSIVIGSDIHTLPTISIVVAKQNSLNHKNKYGNDYDPTDQNLTY